MSPAQSRIEASGTLSCSRFGTMPDGYESNYLLSARWDELLSPSIMPPNLQLTPYRGEWWLMETTARKLIKVSNRHLVALGIWGFQVRGLAYHDAEAKRVDVSPGEAVALVREPSNKYDKNAIAAVVDGATVGYVNKQMAGRLSKVLDAGAPLVAISVVGTAAGMAPHRIQVLAAEPALIDYLITGEWTAG